MNKKVFACTILGLITILSACGGNGNNSSISSSDDNYSSIEESSSVEVESTEVAEEDRQKPESTNFQYENYSMGTSATFDETKWYRNDLQDMALPDPSVIEVGDTYYIYGTTDRTGSQTLDCYSTTDFNNFTLYMNIEKTSDDYWGKKILFAPEVYFYNDVYWLYYSDESKSFGNGLRYINVMTSDSPTGPFVPYKGKNAHGEDVDGSVEPLFTHNKSLGISALDQTIFFDDDGSIYMYYSLYQTNIMQYIVGVKMLDPVTPDWDTYKILIRPGELSPETTRTNILQWECYQDFKVAEGPFMLKSPVNGKYYLTYSVNHYPDRYYTVCYAYSDSPLGDYEKPYTNNGNWTNLLFGYAGGMTGKVYNQWEGFMSGTGHHCFFKCGDQYMIGYHAHKDRKGNSGRMFAMDYIYFDDEGTPYAEGPTYSIQPLPTKISGYSNIALTSKVKSTNVTNPERINDNFIVEHYNLAQEKDREVTLNAGDSYIELDFGKEYNIGGISVYNSAFYDNYLSQIEFINFFNGNVILESRFANSYINDEFEFIFPTSAFVFDFEDIVASRVVIGFRTSVPTNINEIKVFGY